MDANDMMGAALWLLVALIGARCVWLYLPGKGQRPQQWR
jgi:hypothetical protein